MLKLKSLITPAAMVAAFTLAAAPSFAQQKYHGRENRSEQPAGQPQSSGQSREQARPRSEAPRPQAEAPRAQAEAPRTQADTPRPQAGAGAGAAPRQQQAPRAENRVNENRGNQNRANDNRGNDNRGNDNRQVEGRRDDHRGYDSGRAVPRGNVYAPRNEPRYSARYSPRYTPRGYGYYGSRSYNRPYVFRPSFSIGFGIYAGYPVPYSYSYPYPIMVYGYRAPRERVMITPGSPYYGGLALEMTPYDADVFVDGEYAGRVEDFDGSEQPLTLTTGVHEIEVQAQGYEPMRVNVEIRAGQIIPYRGDLRSY